MDNEEKKYNNNWSKIYTIKDYIDSVEMKFGLYPKAKYTLQHKSEVAYMFVTTIRDENNCIGILKQKAQYPVGNKYKFDIFKKLEGEDEKKIISFKYDDL